MIVVVEQRNTEYKYTAGMPNTYCSLGRAKENAAKEAQIKD